MSVSYRQTKEVIPSNSILVNQLGLFTGALGRLLLQKHGQFKDNDVNEKSHSGMSVNS